MTTNHFKLQDSTRPSFLPAHDLFIIHTSTHLVQHDRYRRGSLPGFFRHHDERRPKISKKSCRCCFPDCGIIGSMVISTRTPVVRTTTSVSVCRRGAGRGETAVRRAAGDPHSEALKREHRHGRILPSGCWGHSTGAHSPPAAEDLLGQAASGGPHSGTTRVPGRASTRLRKPQAQTLPTRYKQPLVGSTNCF